MCYNVKLNVILQVPYKHSGVTSHTTVAPTKSAIEKLEKKAVIAKQFIGMLA